MPNSVSPLQGVVSNQGDGLSISTKAMLTQMYQMEVHSNNIANFGMPGYQSETPVVTTFAEVLGTDGIGVAKSQDIGRLRRSNNPMDCALASPGYFVKLNPTTNQLERTRDGRFKLDAEGNLLGLDNKPVLSVSNQPIRFTTIPTDLNKQVKITPEGDVILQNPQTLQQLLIGRLAVVDEAGTPVTKIDVKQRMVEDSNVFLQREFTEMMPIRRNFEANRQLFIMQSDSLSRMIQELGRAQ
jgi:flagellar basal-body rod protein FlgF